MSAEVQTNKLSIYLIKERYSDHAQILKKSDVLSVKQIDGVGVLYYGESYTFRPKWLRTFFGDMLGDEPSIFSSSAKAILLIETETNDSKTRIFAIPFGYGWTLLNPGTYEERFGLKVALSIVNSAGLRQIGKKNLAAIPKDTREQLSKAGVASDFTIDIEQDLILAITGISREESYGASISGKDALSISPRVDLSNIHSFLKDIFKRYQSDAYKKDFPWIDQLSEIKDPILLEELNNQLVKQINDNKLEKTWMAVPEIVEWAEIAGFAYKDKKQDLRDDITLLDFLDSLPKKQREPLELGTLEKKKVYCFSASSEEQRHGPWRAYDCLYCELSDDAQKKTYLLSNGKWYEVENDFANQMGQSHF